MKTTLDIEDRILIEAKALAARERTSLTKLIEQGLTLRLRAKAAQAGPVKIDLPVSKNLGGFRPGIDPCSNKSLLNPPYTDDDT